jgi:hypothetical protein
MNARKLGLAVLVFLALCIPLLAQGPPADGACFYREPNFQGRSFCVGVGTVRDRVPRGFNDHIYSVQVFGRAEAIVFGKFYFDGLSLRLNHSVADMRSLSDNLNPSTPWGGRTSSVQVNFRGDYFRRGRELHWGRGAIPRSGACFYHGPNFEGDYFCMAPGEAYESMPSDFNDAITSVKLVGDVAVVAFNDPGFGGIRLHIGRSIVNLQNWRTSDNPYKNWNNRISSLQVLGSGWNNGRWHPDRDRDDHYWEH